MSRLWAVCARASGYPPERLKDLLKPKRSDSRNAITIFRKSISARWRKTRFRMQHQTKRSKTSGAPNLSLQPRVWPLAQSRS